MTREFKAIETKYRGYRFRSRLEARWAVFFDSLKIDWEYEKEGFALESGLAYLPDFWIPTIETWVEIKPAILRRGEWPDGDDWDRWCEFAAEVDHEDTAVFVCGDPVEYEAFVLHDNGYAWTECSFCSCVGITYEGRGDYLINHADSCANLDKMKGKDRNHDSPRIRLAAERARSARFEHGETPCP